MIDRTTPIGFGLVGAGMIANYHALAIRALAKQHNLRLIGVLGMTQEEALRFAQKHDIPFATDDPQAFFARPDIHVVCVVTPSGAHLEPALQAARAGKHLIIEKPLEITVERVDALLDAAAEADVKVAAIFQSRLTKGAQAVKKAIDEGRFGRLVLCSAYVKWHRAVSYYSGWKGSLALDGGGAVMNQAIHAVDLLQWFAGMPAEISAWKTRRVHLGIEAEDTACAAVRFANGALGTIEATTAAYPGWERRIEICGERGSAVIEDDRIVRWEFRDATPEDVQILADASGNTGASGASAPDQISFEGHQKQIENMVLALRGQSALLVDGAQARNAVAFVRALYESADKGAPVTLVASST
ncbi:MAG: Gfo/Idh/MocA family oxidoreductase [Rhodocyclaceae bacterium]